MRTFSLILLAFAAQHAHAQPAGGECFGTNYDAARGLFTVMRPQPGLVNQQCFITVVPRSADEAPRRALPEGSYVITLSSGGAGGAAGTTANGGAGGPGSAAEQLATYLMPGMYRITLGAGGAGGQCASESAGAPPRAGGPSSVSDAYTGQTVAGVPRAEYWAGSAPVEASISATQEEPDGLLSAIEGGSRVRTPAPGEGGMGGSLRGDAAGRDGVALVTLSGTPGRGGSADRAHLAGGGGGAGFGRGGDGASPADHRPATQGELGGGGGGGHGGRDCSDGAPGGHGFVSIRPAS